ncbi:hypothetical protein GCK72_021264 [Caenorhabditis remanei]|uniref:F-box domain-containing protein n=1 Tax=Caenorhabditis remanei TaxID=31234 RepID=A0A6A5GHN3_CAERE|nr:hypothetical protein GCK72_021264 [Caenorhabditis remanei]KAF1754700.1 hypothetical protein GCK72_021264 [Caenorhabditis remanei]
MTTAFPLLRLPYLVLMPVLEQMELMERIALSLLSKRARMFLKLLKMKGEYINLCLTDNKIKIGVLFDNGEQLRMDISMIRYQEVSMIVYYQNLTCEHYNIQRWHGTLPPMDYVLPIMDVTHCMLVKQLVFPKVSEFDPGYDTTIPLLAKLPKIDEVGVEDFTSNSFSWDSRLQNVLRIVFPVTSAVTIPYHALKPEELREIIRGNFESVTVRKYSVDYMPNHDMKFSLNDLKMTNVRSLEIAGPAFEVEDLNRYFKLWKQKKCNLRLEYLQVATMGCERRKLINLLLKGLKVGIYCYFGTEQTFRVLGNIKQFISEIEDERPTWETEITRSDGRTATIRIGSHGTVCFYVWPESTDDTTNIEPNQSSFMQGYLFLHCLPISSSPLANIPVEDYIVSSSTT